MEGNKNILTQLEVKESQGDEDEFELTIVVKVKMAKPAQTPQLPGELEESVEISGQQYKRDLYKWLIERTDAELIKQKEKIEKLTCYDSKPYNFKTLFGTVPVKRTRIMYEDGRTEVPSHKTWKTPKNISISKGLRAAVCDLAVKTSISNTHNSLLRIIGEKELISERTVLNILHEAGKSIVEAQERRAREI